MNDVIKGLIQEHMEEGDFTFAQVSDKVIEEAEMTLGVNLPGQYIAFLKEYGHGGIGGMCTLGVGLDGSSVFLEETLDYRCSGLPDNLVVIENCDEWLYCIEAETGKIVSWDMTGFIKPEYDCFDDYLLDQMRDAIENL